jgi:hypothetical protein
LFVYSENLTGSLKKAKEELKKEFYQTRYLKIKEKLLKK